MADDQDIERKMPDRGERGRFVSALTPEAHDAIVRNLASGCPPEVAAIAAGVIRQTYYNWMTRGRDAIRAANGNLSQVVEEDPYARLVVDVEEAQTTFIRDSLVMIAAIGRGQAKGRYDALAWVLERRFPQMFGRRSRLDVHGQVTHQHAIALDPEALERLTPEELRVLRGLVEKMEGEVVEAEDVKELTL